MRERNRKTGWMVLPFVDDRPNKVWWELVRRRKMPKTTEDKWKDAR